jgi:hypothetical protein
MASRIETPPGQGFDPLWAGPNATNVPQKAVVVDSTSPEIVFNDTVGSYPHDQLNGTSYYGGSEAYAYGLTYSFDGVAIWYDYTSYLMAC